MTPFAGAVPPGHRGSLSSAWFLHLPLPGQGLVGVGSGSALGVGVEGVAGILFGAKGWPWLR